MRERAGLYFAQVLELADVIAQKGLVSWRTAHHIVGKVVHQAIAKGLKAREIDKALVDQAAVEIVGHPLAISEQEVQQALDPQEFVRRRALTGGPAPSEVKRMLGARKRELAADRKAFKAVQDKVEQSLKALYKRIYAVVG